MGPGVLIQHAAVAADGHSRLAPIHLRSGGAQAVLRRCCFNALLLLAALQRLDLVCQDVDLAPQLRRLRGLLEPLHPFLERLKSALQILRILRLDNACEKSGEKNSDHPFHQCTSFEIMIWPESVMKIAVTS